MVRLGHLMICKMSALGLITVGFSYYFYIYQVPKQTQRDGQVPIYIEFCSDPADAKQTAR